MLLVKDITVLRPHDFMNCVYSEVGAETSYMAAWKSHAINKKRNAEEINKSYQFAYGNLGNITAFEVDADNQTCALDDKTFPPPTIRQARQPRKNRLRSRGDTAMEN
ncbi:15351_t:CDS:2 [Gigaspora margarita]|uniref:15351_t:CDS:1 n=1 Tax=Gigaspora margarita TaxID=4874 RepID=A0ABN7UGN9_GIGMA|nr:15351_t:CDS:2 [Gigaspora margarita]